LGLWSQFNNLFLFRIDAESEKIFLEGQQKDKAKANAHFEKDVFF
jgi:hypothetical protein